MDHVDCIVAGAGVIGLSVARALAMAGRDVLVIEAQDGIGSETSSRNSEVIHAGIYYAPGSAKAVHCVEGRERLYRFCQERGLPHRRCGKLIVASDAGQEPALEDLLSRARQSGVHDMAVLDGRQAGSLEPALRATAALLSPSTGILDSHAFMLALQGEAEDHGADFAFATRIEGGRIERDGIVLRTRSRAEAEPFSLSARCFVNAAGLDAVRLASSIEGFPAAHLPVLRLAKGNYFAAPGRSPFERLIYPVPVDGGLGVHLTFDLAGQMRFGPDVEWVDHVDYRVDPRRCEGFHAAISRYFPDLGKDSLAPAYSGIRPKLSGPGEPAADFRIDGPQSHGVAGMINLFGIESPGLTSSLSIATKVSELAG